MDNRISVACKLADHILWEAYAQSTDEDEDFATHIIFPQYRDGNLRVSEQEARFAFVEALCQGPLLYSVEAPTSKTYQFDGNTPLSAQTDLSVYDGQGGPICNIEFKAKGVSPNAEGFFKIYKDLQKLLREPVRGVWFHLLESVNNSTINDLLDVITTQIDQVENNFGNKDIDSEELTLHVCVLKHGFSLEREIPFRDNGLMNIHVDLDVSRTELNQVNNLNGWSLHKR